MRDGAFGFGAVGGEVLKFVDGAAEGDDCGFTARAENRLREEDAGFAKFRQERGYAQAVFHEDDHGHRVAAEIEVRDGLRHAVIGDAKIFYVQAVNHFALFVAYDYRSVDEGDLRFDGSVRRRLRGGLNGDTGGRSHGTVGRLRDGGLRCEEDDGEDGAEGCGGDAC